MHKWISRLTATLVGLTLAQAAWADLPHGTLQFITPNATVGVNDPIQVWVKLTLDANSSAMNFSSYPLTGFAAADLPTQGSAYDPATNSYMTADFAHIDSAAFGARMNCSPGFDCPGTGTDSYTFNFADNANSGLVYQTYFNLNPGQSYDYLFGQFTPKAGGAAPGVYQLTNVELLIFFTGVDAAGHVLYFSEEPGIATSCNGGTTLGCAFTRTVMAVPEPSSYAMLGLGLLAIAGVARKKALKTARLA